MKKRQVLSSTQIDELLRLPTLTYGQVARCAGCSETGLRAAMSRGEVELPVIQVGSRRLIPTSAVRRWLQCEVVSNIDSIVDSVGGGYHFV